MGGLLFLMESDGRASRSSCPRVRLDPVTSLIACIVSHGATGLEFGTFVSKARQVCSSSTGTKVSLVCLSFGGLGPRKEWFFSGL
jgi:hypothetical protein